MQYIKEEGSEVDLKIIKTEKASSDMKLACFPPNGCIRMKGMTPASQMTNRESDEHNFVCRILKLK